MGKKDNKKYNAKSYFTEKRRKDNNRVRLNNEIKILKNELQDLKEKLKKEK